MFWIDFFIFGFLWFFDTSLWPAMVISVPLFLSRLFFFKSFLSPVTNYKIVLWLLISFLIWMVSGLNFFGIVISFVPCVLILRYAGRLVNITSEWRAVFLILMASFIHELILSFFYNRMMDSFFSRYRIFSFMIEALFVFVLLKTTKTKWIEK